MRERFQPYLNQWTASELKRIAGENGTTPTKIIEQAVEHFLIYGEGKRLMNEAARELREEGQAARELLLDGARRERDANRQLLQQLLDGFVQLMNDVSSSTTNPKPKLDNKDGKNPFGIPVNK